MKQNLLERAEQLGLPPRSAVLDLDRPRPSLAFPTPSHPPLRVALLGCGTVGGGVLRHLLHQPERFEVTGVLVRGLRKDRGGVPRHLFTTDAEELLGRGTDVVVELLGGVETAGHLVRDALRRGRSVVTANKALLAEEIGPLSALARAHGAHLLGSASVGGALPALETVRRAAALGPLRTVSGVLNGTCNFVLDRWLEGIPFADAVKEAQAAGYAEADPTLDLDGSDTAQKLALLAREAFGLALPWRDIPRQGLHDLAPPRHPGHTLRLIATCERTGHGFTAHVRPVELPLDHPFARTKGADNALRIEMEDGSLTELRAPGAGRGPTAASVLADLSDLHALLTTRRGLVEVAV